MDESMPSVDDNGELVFRHAVRSASGPRRDINQDAGNASERLLAVADDTGGWEAGQAASSAAIDAIRQLDTQISNEEVLDTLDRAIRSAHGSLRDMANRDPALKSMGATLTAIVLAGPQLGLVHTGDTRAYVLRDSEFLQLTIDHTLLQLMLLDDGRVTKDYLASHPQIRRNRSEANERSAPPALPGAS